MVFAAGHRDARVVSFYWHPGVCEGADRGLRMFWLRRRRYRREMVCRACGDAGAGAGGNRWRVSTGSCTEEASGGVAATEFGGADLLVVVTRLRPASILVPSGLLDAMP